MNYRKKANITLALVALGFVIISVLMYFISRNNSMKALFFIIEAALIGGMADWFAVTAIFKKPLGFPFHTAIIPKNRKTIVNSVVRIIEKEFLSAELISRRLENIRITSRLIEWTDSEKGRKYLKAAAVKYLKAMKNKDLEPFYNILKEQLSSKLINIDLNKQIQGFVECKIRDGSYKKVMLFLLDDIIKVAEGPRVRDKILNTIESIKAEKTQGILGALFNSALQESNLINIPEIADSIHMQLIQTLYSLRDDNNEDTKVLLDAIEEHFLLNGRFEIDAEASKAILMELVDEVVNIDSINFIIDCFVHELQNEYSEINYEINDNKHSIIESSLTFDEEASEQAHIAKNVVLINEAAITENSSNNVLFCRVILSQVSKTWQAFKNDKETLLNIEQIVKDTINQLIQKEHSVIGKIVRDTLESFDDEALNKFIEDRAGNDLQWIRINGCIVGGIVGLLVFLFLTYFYDPIAVPLIRGLFGL